MPLGASRLNFLAKTQEAAAVEQRTAKTITVNGDIQLDTAVSKFGGSSMLSDTSGDYLDVSPSIPASGDFTVEYWYYAKQSTVNRAQWGQGDGQTANDISCWALLNRTGITVRIGSSASKEMEIVASTTLTADTWYHIALVRDGSTFELFINGTSYGTDTSSTTINQDDFRIRANGYTPTQNFGWGNFDEVRVSDTARYTTGFTAPTAPFVNDANTVLLIHADGTDGDTVFIDDNGDRLSNGVQAFGNASITTSQQKIGNSSIGFDGSGDYLQIPYSDDLAKWNQQAYTLEYWVKLDSLTGTSYPDGASAELPNGFGNKAPTANTNYWSFGPIDDGSVVMFYYTGSKQIVQTSGVTLTTGTWYHLAMVYDGSSTIKIYVDGTERASASVSGTPQFSSSFPISIGAAGGATVYMDGYIDELRVSDTERYTSGFTPSTTAFENDDNTLLLLHGEQHDADTTVMFDDNGATLPTPPSANYRTDANSSSLVLVAPFDYLNEFADVHADIKGSGSNITPTVGSNASITTTQRKWTSSPDYQKGYEGIATSGQSQTQYTLGTSIPDCNSGSNTYVVEGWFYANNATTNANWCLSSGDSGGRWLFGINSGSTFSFGGENNIGIGSGWHHLAIVLDSGTKRFYYDGIYKGAWSSVNTGFSTLHVGQFNAGDTNDFRGHIQDLRVYVGTNNGYTGTNSGSANFTLPSSIIQSYS